MLERADPVADKGILMQVPDLLMNHNMLLLPSDRIWARSQSKKNWGLRWRDLDAGAARWQECEAAQM